MNKDEIKKIESFIKEISELPDEIITEDESLLFISESSNEINKKRVKEKQNLLLGKAENIKAKLIAYLRAILGEASTSYINSLNEITFKTKDFVFNTLHYRNNELWYSDKQQMLKLLNMIKTQFEETIRIEQQNPENSLKAFFKSTQAKGIILTSILTITGLFITKDLWWNRILQKQPIEQNFSHRDSLIIIDKKNVVEAAVKEVFRDFYSEVQMMESKYAPTSAVSYINDFVGKDSIAIQQKIDSKSYINRFSSYSSLWSEADIKDVNTLIKFRTIIRTREILQNVENNSEGPFVFSDEKIELLKKQVEREIK